MTKAEIKTAKGTMKVEFFDKDAPKTVENFIKLAKESYETTNVRFEIQNISQKFKHKFKNIDCFVSFMLLQNLKSYEINDLFFEVNRCLKPTGFGVFLTIHPEIFDSQWSLHFIKYDRKKILKWKSERQNNLLIKGFVKNSTGGKKPVFMYTYSKTEILKLISKNNLIMIDDIPIYIDQNTAEKFFGKRQNSKYPTTPIFWIFSVAKSVT